MRVEDFTDVAYEVADGGVAVITINRPERMNAFRGRTVDELVHAFKVAWSSREVAALVLTGAGDRAFCAGGDVKERATTGSYGDTQWGTFEIER
ncbi:MAG TPA: enoyl-CoA hydratase-related protein, partial [Micromonosporaceae bacterium]|nr:enoyl-CoA hydratase-related protein [Micromonosporaceae bacterium]